MFVCDEWRDCTFNRRQDGTAIAKLVYIDFFWDGMLEVCTISEPLVKALRLVDGEKQTYCHLLRLSCRRSCGVARGLWLIESVERV